MMSFLLLAIVFPFIAGLAFLPVWVWLKLPLPRQLMGRVWFIFGQICYNGSIAFDSDGEIDLKPFDKERSEFFDAEDEEWKPVDTDAVYRTGWRPFAIVPDTSPDAVGQYAVETVDASAVADGGYALLNRSSGGYRLATEYPTGDPNGTVVDTVRYVKDIGRGGNRLLNHAEEYALRKFGGDDNMGDLVYMGSMIGSFVLMFLMTWFLI